MFLMSQVPLYLFCMRRETRPICCTASFRCLLQISLLQGYLAHKKHPPPRTLQWDFLGSYGGPRGGGRFLMIEVPL